MKKKILILFFASFIAMSQPVYTYADAASLTIIGASGTGGLTTASLSAFLPEVAAIIGGVLVAKGINVYLTNAAQAQGKTKTQFIQDSIELYCKGAMKDTGEFCGNIMNDIKVGNQGAIELGSQAREQIKQFVNFLYQYNRVVDNTPSSTGDILNLGNDRTTIYTSDVTFRTVSNYSFRVYASSSFGMIFVKSFAGASEGYVYAITTSPVLINRQRLLNGNVDAQDTTNRWINRNNIYYCAITNAATGNIPAGWYQGVGTVEQVIDSFTGVSVGNTPVELPNNTFTGTQADKDALDRALSPSAGNTSVLNPNILQDLINSLGGITDAMMGIRDYLDALGKAVDGVAGGVRVRDRDTDLPYDITYDPDEPFDPDLDTENPDDSAVPVVDPNEPADVNMQIEPLKMNLKTIFPFCIPFDVVDMVKLLDATPVAPSYTVNWNIPIVNQNLTFTVDLSPFNSVAAILRNLEVIIFCIGLAMVTRSMFIRG